MIMMTVLLITVMRMAVMLITMMRMTVMLITMMRVAVNPRSTYPHFPPPWAAEPHAPILLRQPDMYHHHHHH